MSKVIVDRKVLHAISMFQAVKDVRFYLNGVFIEYNEMETRVAASNGCMIGVYRQDARADVAREIDGNEGAGSFVIPSDAVKTVLAWRSPQITVAPVPNDAGRYSATSASGNALHFKAIDASYPDFRRVMQRGPVSGVACQLDPSLLVAFHKAAVALHDGDKKRTPIVAIGWNGESAMPIEVNGDPGFAGILMPIRADKRPAPTASPSWAYSALPDAPEVADTAEVQ